ncbi:hypothetical protein COO60DRAFT_1486882 [Scenedesmus sp. NREL 46B-D3]|nr:hypothetical protein COO60DRAFT_1486882 [Scenedesmus sp. NREL 46B-D3]
MPCSHQQAGVPHKARWQHDEDELHLLPRQLQELHLTARDAVSSGDVQVAVSHLTVLQQAVLCLYKPPAACSALSAGLTALTVALRADAAGSGASPLGITALQQLQALHAADCWQEEADLLQLTRLELYYTRRDAAHAAAPALRDLPASRLELEESVVEKFVHTCALLKGLQQLQHLALCVGLHNRADIMCLTALTNLTSLDLRESLGADDVADLRLHRCGVSSAAVLPVSAALTRLTQLQLSMHESVAAELITHEQLLLLSTST